MVFIFTNTLPNLVIQLTTILIAFIFGLVFLLIFSIGFGEKFINRILRSPKAKFEDLVEGTIETAHKVQLGDIETAKQSANGVVTQLLNWYLRTNFYRWMIGTSIALLIASGTFAGTVLLGEQNKKFDLQNDLATVTLTNFVRDQLNTSPTRKTYDANHSDYTDARLWPTINVNTNETECTINIELDEKHEIFPVASGSAVASIIALAEKKNLKTDLVTALRNLLYDEKGNIALSALMVLEGLGEREDNLTLNVTDILIDDRLEIMSPISLSIKNSIVAEVSCDNCQDVEINGSIIDDVDSLVEGGANLSINNSAFIDVEFGNSRSLKHISGQNLVLIPNLLYQKDYIEEETADALFSNHYFFPSYSPGLQGNPNNLSESPKFVNASSDFACFKFDIDFLEEDGFCKNNPFFSCLNK